MADLHSPHDRVFKAIFTRAEIAGEFLHHLYSLLRYLSCGPDRLSAAALTHAVEHTFKRGPQIMNTIAAEWTKEGKLEGIPQGEAQILRRQLTRRFGARGCWLGAIHELPLRADRILEAESLDAVFAG